MPEKAESRIVRNRRGADGVVKSKEPRTGDMTKNKFVRFQRERKVLEPGAMSPGCACGNYLMWREFFDMSGARIFDLLVYFYR